MAAVPTSGMMLGPHRRRRYVKPETPAPEAPSESPAESQPETVESPETGTSVPAELTKVADLLEWVGDDKARAQAVLTQENSKPESEVRVTLVSKLTSIIEADLI